MQCVVNGCRGLRNIGTKTGAKPRPALRWRPTWAADRPPMVTLRSFLPSFLLLTERRERRAGPSQGAESAFLGQ